jgi:hypothetical protein
MSDIVFILGAGASKQAGAPLVGDFLDVAAGLLWSGKVEGKKDDFIRVFETIGGLWRVNSKAQLDLTNLESVFTALEFGRVIRRVPGLKPSEIAESIASLKQLIVTTLETTIAFPIARGNSPLIAPPPPYGEFGKLVKFLVRDATPAHSVSVITFNYDICVDLALQRVGFRPDYAIATDDGSTPTVPLLKLHGSLNWAADTSTQKILTLALRDLDRELCERYAPKLAFPDTSALAIPFTSLIRDYYTHRRGLLIDPEPVIVPPSWNKTDYHNAFSDVWARAAEHLSAARFIFVIGYALPPTDLFFRHLYALGTVGESPLQKIAVYNPEPEGGEVDKRFRELVGTGTISRYGYRPIRFDEAIGEIGRSFGAMPKTAPVIQGSISHGVE